MLERHDQHTCPGVGLWRPMEDDSERLPPGERPAVEQVGEYGSLDAAVAAIDRPGRWVLSDPRTGAFFAYVDCTTGGLRYVPIPEEDW